MYRRIILYTTYENVYNSLPTQQKAQPARAARSVQSLLQSACHFLPGHILDSPDHTPGLHRVCCQDLLEITGRSPRIFWREPLLVRREVRELELLRVRLTRQRGREGGHHVVEEEVCSQECENSQAISISTELDKSLTTCQ